MRVPQYPHEYLNDSTQKNDDGGEGQNGGEGIGLLQDGRVFHEGGDEFRNHHGHGSRGPRDLGRGSSEQGCKYAGEDGTVHAGRGTLSQGFRGSHGSKGRNAEGQGQGKGDYRGGYAAGDITF